MIDESKKRSVDCNGGIQAESQREGLIRSGGMPRFASLDAHPIFESVVRRKAETSQLWSNSLATCSPYQSRLSHPKNYQGIRWALSRASSTWNRASFTLRYLVAFS